MPQPCVRIDGGYALEKPWKVVQNASNSSPAADNRFDLPGGTAACWDGPECRFRIYGCERRREECPAHNGHTKGDLTACRVVLCPRCAVVPIDRGLPSWQSVLTGFLQSCGRHRMRDHAATAARQRRCAGGLRTVPERYAPSAPLLSHLVICYDRLTLSVETVL